MRRAAREFLTALLVCSAIAAGAPRAAAAETALAVAPAAATEAGGAQLYQIQCARCHGPGARGDGPDAAFFVRPPRDLRSGFLELYDTAELVARIRDGRSLPLELDADAVRRRAAEVEFLTAYLQTLPNVNWRKVERGNEIYLDRCEPCHGPFGRPLPAPFLPAGVQRPPRDLSDAKYQKSVSDAELLKVVQHGRQGMPAIPHLADPADTQALLAYVRTLSPGLELYSYYCAGCHGDDGRGAGDLAEAAQQPPVVFDAVYFKKTDPETLRRKVWHMLDQHASSMPHLRRRLTDEQARAIVEYLRQSDPSKRPEPSPSAK